MISGVNHITLSVGDVDRAFHFYVETLGARPLARWSKGAYLLAGDLWLCLVLDERTAFFAVARVLAHRIGPPIPGTDFELVVVRVEKIERGAFAFVLFPDRRPRGTYPRGGVMEPGSGPGSPR